MHIGLRIAIILIITITGTVQAQPPVQQQEARAAFIEECAMSIRIGEGLQPVEIQPDSLLGFDQANHVFVAVLCQPNPLRTFHPPAERLQSDDIAVTNLAVETSSGIEVLEFHSIRYRRQNHPLRRMNSMNLFFASRDYNYYITAYPDPAIVRKQTNEETVAMDAKLAAMIQLTARNILLQEGAKPAITEEQYHTRLIAVGAAILIAAAAMAGSFLYRRRKRSAHRAGYP